MNETIKIMIEQFCGNITTLKKMLGAYDMTYHNDENEFNFKFKGCRKINFCSLKYNRSSDTYSMLLGKISTYNYIPTFKPVQEFHDLYCDPTTFEQETNLHLLLRIV